MSILVVDAVGYTRQMGHAEDETHRRVSALLTESFQNSIRHHQGKLIKLTGDGLMASFPSVLDAVHCAVSMQRQAASSRPLSTGEKIEFRIGVHIGDVIVDHNEFYGDCVNIAVRIESVADPGGVCISRTVYDQVHSKVPYRFENLGRLPLKNVVDPPEVLRVIWAARVAGNNTGPAEVLIARQRAFIVPKTREPIIGIRPLDAPGGDSRAAVAASCLTRELCVILEGRGWFGIRRLNNLPDSISRQPVMMGEHDCDRDTLYRIEGHVAAQPGRIRVVIQLLDSISGFQLWAGRFSLRTDDLAKSGERTALQAAAEIEVKVQRHEFERYGSANPADLDIYGLTQLAYSHYYHRSRSENELALHHFDNVLRLSPGYALAAAGKAACHFWAGQQHWTDDSERALYRANELASRAVAADPQLAWARLILAQSELYLGRHDAAIKGGKIAASLNPGNPAILAFLGHALTASGSGRSAIRALRSAFALAPYHANRFIWLSNVALAEYHIHRFDHALTAATEASQLNPGHWLANQVQIASLSRLGRIEDARFLLQNVESREGSDGVSNRLPYKMASGLEYVVEALRIAGWSSTSTLIP